MVTGAVLAVLFFIAMCTVAILSNKWRRVPEFCIGAPSSHSCEAEKMANLTGLCAVSTYSPPLTHKMCHLLAHLTRTCLVYA